MCREIKVGDKFRHFKGGVYEITDFATHTESGESLVIYKDTLAPEKVWARPKEMFDSLVDKEKYPEINQKYRFEKIN